MPRKFPTSIVLSEQVNTIKLTLAPIYGLKNILSAGLLLFSRLSSDDQKKIISEVNADEDVPCQTTLVLLTEEETANLRRFQADMMYRADKKKHKKETVPTNLAEIVAIMSAKKRKRLA
jgi:hypothetical protein